MTVEPREATERKGESKADSAEHAVSVSGKEDSGNGSFSLGFEGLAIAKGKNLKVSDIQKKVAVNDTILACRVCVCACVLGE